MCVLYRVPDGSLTDKNKTNKQSNAGRSLPCLAVCPLLAIHHGLFLAPTLSLSCSSSPYKE